MSKRKKRGLGVDVVEEIVRDYGHLARTWANEHHVAFRIANSGQHWIFTLDTHTVEWWPSTGRCVVDYRTGSPITVLSYQALLPILDRSFAWPARRQAQAAAAETETPAPDPSLPSVAVFNALPRPATPLKPDLSFKNPVWKDRMLASEHMHLQYYTRPIIRCGQSIGKTRSSFEMAEASDRDMCYSVILKIWTNPQQVWTAQHVIGPGTSFVAVLSDRGGTLRNLETYFAEAGLGLTHLTNRDHILYRIFTFFCHTGLLPMFPDSAATQVKGVSDATDQA
jgi:hypothetical protein